MTFNLVVLIFVNILFQNQNTILNTYDPTFSPANPAVTPVATICIHSIGMDYWQVFKNNISQGWLTVIQSIQMFIFIPSLFGTVMVLNYSGKLIGKYYNNMKLLLTSYEDNPP